MSTENFLANVNKKLKDKNPNIIHTGKSVEFIKTGNIVFDSVVGGFPKSMITMLYGMEHSGKSTLMMSSAAELQRKGELSVYLNFEGGFNADYAKKMFGLNIDQKTCILLQPTYIEEADEILAQMEESGVVPKAIFIDSIAAMRSKGIVETAMEDPQKIGGHSGPIARFFNKLNPLAMRKDIAIVCTNQLRDKIETSMFDKKKSAVGDKGKHVLTGGQTPRFLSSLMVEITSSAVKEEAMDERTGQLDAKTVTSTAIEFYIRKNRCGRPFMTFKSHLDLGFRDNRKPGWSVEDDILFYLTSNKKIEQKGPTFTYTGTTEEMSFTARGKEAGQNQLLQTERYFNDAKAQLIKLLSNGSGINTQEKSDAVYVEDDEEETKI